MPSFQESKGAIVNNSNFVDINGSGNVVNVGQDTRRGEGIKLLLDSYVQREAIHDSDSRGDLGCHPGTREEYIRIIASWGRTEWKSQKRAFLMIGPAGAGKSAIARTCAYKLKVAGNLGASFFFYRPNRWNDPKKFFPTIVYQLTTRYPAYRDCIDAVIRDDPLVLDKAMDIQFLELLVKPLLLPSVNGCNIESGLVIIVDGLDECATIDAQMQIVRLITTSIHEQTTPFMWAFFSRPEPPITSTFSSKIAENISWTLPLTLSNNADKDIEAYLRGGFKTIRAKHNIASKVTWPAEGDIRRLVSQSAGLFVYAATAIRYIDGLDSGKAGFEERLHSVLQVELTSTKTPFSALDQLYKLLMMQIPEGVLSDTLSLLHLNQSDIFREFSHINLNSREPPQVASYCSALGLSSAAFHVAISNLYSVLEVTWSQSEEPESLQFYHKSFLDFLLDGKRSEQYFIQSLCVHRHCLNMVVRTLCSGANSTTASGPDGFPVQAFFTLVERHAGKLEESILLQISQVDWKYWRWAPCSYKINPRTFTQKIPKAWRRRIIRPSSSEYSSPLSPLFNRPVTSTIFSLTIHGNRLHSRKRGQKMFDTEIPWATELVLDSEMSSFFETELLP